MRYISVERFMLVPTIYGQLQRQFCIDGQGDNDFWSMWKGTSNSGIAPVTARYQYGVKYDDSASASFNANTSTMTTAAYSCDGCDVIISGGRQDGVTESQETVEQVRTFTGAAYTRTNAANGVRRESHGASCCRGVDHYELGGNSIFSAVTTQAQDTIHKIKYDDTAATVQYGQLQENQIEVRCAGDGWQLLSRHKYSGANAGTGVEAIKMDGTANCEHKFILALVVLPDAAAGAACCSDGENYVLSGGQASTNCHSIAFHDVTAEITWNVSITQRQAHDMACSGVGRDIVLAGGRTSSDLTPIGTVEYIKADALSTTRTSATNELTLPVKAAGCNGYQ